MRSRTVVRQLAMTCPACAKEVFADLVLEIGALNPSGKDGRQVTGSDVVFEVTGRVIGARFSHDCVPSVTR